MTYGYGRGPGGRGGAGLGFRGTSPPWPYIGRGRGGLPRCQYPGAAFSTGSTPVPANAAQMTREQEIDYLKSQSGQMKKELKRMADRISELENAKKE